LRSPRATSARTACPKYGYAVDRGTLTQLDGHSALLWVNGNARDATLTGRPYLQGGKGTPRPLLLTRHVGRGPLAQPAAQVLALSKMDWNTDALYSSMPATIGYAQLLARIVKHEHLPPVPYDYRLFM
jgi:argonaute-like protein implicated in RNA metabolism and viral defense